ncbi:MAG: L-histidine N(alpha)-methyltransferase [Acidobacteria bacterium]|nr:L-histidine N(alpha)-methyltransferase [Acidobacteriota bacterium]MBV9144455.1 L-histidine N(alpha)-methyltransferase [Acidobacteriota bacterium]MBV9436184.1 L-histidine N(alpha)-methyltransferase [Acidobacteriota bacterium]
MSFGIDIFVLLREEQILKELRKAFAERYLPEHLFYWLPSSIQAWVALCRSTEYKNASRASEVLRLAAPGIRQRCEGGTTLCGLGCGEGGKDLVLLQEFHDAGQPLRYIAADFSQALLELAIDQSQKLVKSAAGLKLNVFDDEQLAVAGRLAREVGGCAIFSVLGNTLGAFGPQAFPSRLRQCCVAHDCFLFDGEIFSETSLAGYDNPTNRRFAWGPLTGVGITEEDGRLEFSTEALDDGLFGVSKHFVAGRNLRINVGGEWIDIRRGETLRMSNSIKYRNEATLLGFVERAGFKIEMKWTSSDNQFVLAFAKPS